MTPKEAYKALQKNNLTEEEIFDLECIIAEDSSFSLDYAQNILRDKPFPLGEQLIALSEWVSFQYASYIIVRRFELGEKSIFKNETRASRYKKAFLTERKEFFS